uniref:Uncharacterized protein n=1 Tax=Cyprinus carpio TaxID=7962 RepID=A0A8C2GHY4_CYPCA
MSTKTTKFCLTLSSVHSLVFILLNMFQRFYYIQRKVKNVDSSIQLLENINLFCLVCYCASLHTHRLSSCNMNAKDCADLSSALRSIQSHLRELDLSENHITDSGVTQLSPLLANPQCKLEKLWLRSCYITQVSCTHLSSALRSNPSHLRELDLSENNITQSGLKQISDLLKDPQYKLEKLWLQSNGEA